MTDKKFIEGINLKEHKFDNGGSIIKVGVGENFINYFNENKNDRGFLNFDIKTSKKGNVYAELNTFKPKTKSSDYVKEETKESFADDFDDEIPF